MATHRILAIAVATGRVGYVLLKGRRLRDWGLSRKASTDPAHAVAQAKRWIEELEPDVVVTEKVAADSRKGEKTRSLIAAIAALAERVEVMGISVRRPRQFANKYDEAEALVAWYPELAPWRPTREKLWQAEPRSTVYFEALVLGLQALAGPDKPALLKPG